MSDNHRLDTDRQVFFYENDFYVLSNFSAFQINYLGWHFPTSEHAYHWSKFPGPACEDIRFQIRNAISAHDAFKMGQQWSHLRDPDWNARKLTVMRNLLQCKVRQHAYVRTKLLATGDRELIEDSWRDDFWGWGPNRDGQNMLGRLWMEVRAELRASPATKEPDHG